MSAQLRLYLLDAYESRRSAHLPRKISRDIPIQIDDQDDNDALTEFCNIFCTVGKRGSFKIDLVGNFPITREMADLAEIYDGHVDSTAGHLLLQLNYARIEVLMDLADKIRKTSFLGDRINNPGWLRVSARTISSIYRFVRIMKEYRHQRVFG